MDHNKIIVDNFLLLGNIDRYKNYRDIIDKYSYKAHELYVKNLWERIKNVMPIVVDDKVIMSYNSELKNEMDIIRQYSSRLAMEGCYIQEKEEKIQTLNKIWILMLDDFMKIIRENPMRYLIGFMSELEYNRFITMNLVMWCKNNIYQETKDIGINQLLQSLQYFNQISQIITYDTELSISRLYVDVENLLATDEHSLERAIEIIFYILKREEDTVEERGNEYKFEEVLELSRSMFYIQMLKLEMIEGDYKNKPLEFDNKGNIILDENYSSEMKKRYYSAMSSSNPHEEGTVNNSRDNRLNKLAEKYVGISLRDILQVLNVINIDEVNDDEFLVGSIGEWKEMFRAYSKDIQGGEKFFDYMCLQADISNIYIEETIRGNRVARSCILPINDMIICPAGLFKYCIMNIYLDILGGEVGNKSFREKIKGVLQDEDDQFEVDVYNSLSAKLKTSLIKHDIKEKDINVNGQIVVLPGQIDVLLLYKKQIFVIECKNIRLKITVKSRINDKNRLIVNKPKSYQFKLDKKIQKIIEYKQAVVSYMGGDWDDYAGAIPKGIIVSKSFIDVDNKEGNKYPVVSWDRLIEWIEDSTRDN